MVSLFCRSWMLDLGPERVEDVLVSFANLISVRSRELSRIGEIFLQQSFSQSLLLLPSIQLQIQLWEQVSNISSPLPSEIAR